MSSLAILMQGREGFPRAVRIGVTDEALCIFAADGTISEVPYWRLFRMEDEGTTHRFRRVDMPHWELRVTSGNDRALLAHIGRKPFTKAFGLFQRMQGLKIAAGLLVLTATILTHLPADLSARLLPEAAQRRLVSGVLGHQTNYFCHGREGIAALRKLLFSLDPVTSASVELVPMRYDGYAITSLPTGKIILSRTALTEFHQGALAALLAHELAHIRNGDPPAATVRYNGLLATWAAVLEGEDRRELYQQFSAQEEQRADLEAMHMLKVAGIRLAPAAELFEEMRIAAAARSGFAADMREFHFGLPDRAARWSAAARAQPATAVDVLTLEEEDSIFNVCWQGQILPSQVRGTAGSHPPSQSALGSGAVGTRN